MISFEAHHYAWVCWREHYDESGKVRELALTRTFHNLNHRYVRFAPARTFSRSETSDLARQGCTIWMGALALYSVGARVADLIPDPGPGQ